MIAVAHLFFVSDAVLMLLAQWPGVDLLACLLMLTLAAIAADRRSRHSLHRGYPGSGFYQVYTF